MIDSEKDQIGRALQGDTQAFAGIYQAHSGMVYGIALRMLGMVEDAEEVTQDVFVAAHRSLKTFAGDASLKTWLYRITVNTALNALKRRKRRAPEMSIAEGFDPADPHQDPIKAQGKAEALDTVQRMLAEVDADQRACLILRAQEGLSYEQIAQTLGININTVRSRLKRGREAAMKALQQKGIEQ